MTNQAVLRGWDPSVGAKGADTSGSVNASQVQALKALGFEFLIRALLVPSGSIEPKALTIAEIAVIRGGGLALGLYQMFQTASLSAAQGTKDGQSAAAQAAALAVPKGTTIYGDSEGQSSTSAQAEIDYWNAWGAAIAAGGYAAGLYVGPGPKMSGAQLGALSTIHGYWQAGAADMPFPSPRGYQLFQLNPSNQVIAGQAFDVDVAQVDFKGGTSTFWAPL